MGDRQAGSGSVMLGTDSPGQGPYWKPYKPGRQVENEFAGKDTAKCSNPHLFWFVSLNLYSTDTYKRAREKLALSEETSDLQTDVDEAQTQRKRK